MASSIRQGISVGEFARLICKRDFVTGYVFQTVPVAAYAWFVHHGDFSKAVRSVIGCGGDADTTGAIIGALAGATVGLSGIPPKWVEGVVDWPRGIDLCKRISTELAAAAISESSRPSIWYFRPAIIPRNLFFIFVVLYHGLRRLLPPY